LIDYICGIDAATKFKFCAQMHYGPVDQKLRTNAAGVRVYNFLWKIHPYLHYVGA